MKEIKNKILEFNKRRGWDKYHDPRSLILALVGEVGELAQLFRWRKRTGRRISARALSTASDEIADIFIFLFTLCAELGIDPEEAVLSKLEANKNRFPTADQ